MNQGKAAVRKRLKAELVEAEKELRDLEQQLETNKPEFGLGTGSTGFDLWEVNMVRRENVVARIDALRDALARLDEDGFGRCEQCGAKIDPERLEILPTTTLCVDCARRGKAAAGSPAIVRSRTTTRR